MMCGTSQIMRLMSDSCRRLPFTLSQIRPRVTCPPLAGRMAAIGAE